MSLRTLDVIPDIRALHWPRRDDYIAFDTSDTQVTPREAPSNSSPFLRLPRELRDMVYIYFLDARRSAPPSPPFAGPRIHRLEHDDTSEQRVPQKDIAYPISIAQSNIDSLLRTSRIIRSEVLQLVDKRNRHNSFLPAQLDIMAKGYILYPLWTHLPMLAGHNTSLNVRVTLRIFTPEAFRAHDGPPRRPCHAIHGLLKLLNQFLTCGPAFTRINRTARPATVIDTLTIRLENYDIYTPRMFPPAVQEMKRMCKALSLRADIRPSLRRIRIEEEDTQRSGLGFLERGWSYDVASACDEDELMDLTELWEDMGFVLESDSASFYVERFGTS